MFTIPNQSSIPKAYTQFTGEVSEDGSNRLMEGGNRDRLVDCMEEFVKYTILIRPHFALLADRFSEREEKRRKSESGRGREENDEKKDEVKRVRMGNI